MTAYMCVVVGEKFKNDCLKPVNDIDKRNSTFITTYRIKLPAGYAEGTFFRETGLTDFAMFDYLRGGVEPQPGNQDGGNGSGGDAAGPGQHVLASVATAEKMSFWKFDKRSAAAEWGLLSVDQKADRQEKAKVRSPEVNAAYQNRAIPGCVFLFSSVDRAYAWLKSKSPRGGYAIYDVYEEVRIIGVNADDGDPLTP